MTDANVATAAEPEVPASGSTKKSATRAYAAQSPDARLAPFQIERRAPRPHDVQIEILYSGVCHSDIHMARNEWGQTIYPVVPGHEIVGRVVKTVDAYTNGTPTNSSDKTTEFTYDGDGNMLTLQADLVSGGYQKTQWVYGTSTSTGDVVNSNDILKQVRWPDPTSGNPSTSGV